MDLLARLLESLGKETFTLVLGLLAGLLPLVEKVLRQYFERKPPSESYSQKLENLTGSLVKASSEVDQLLAELAAVAKDRAVAAEKLQAELQQLEDHERQLKQRLEDLQAVPIPVAEHFAALVEKGERRSAWRDYILFGLGVIVSTIIAILLKAAGLA